MAKNAITATLVVLAVGAGVGYMFLQRKGGSMSALTAPGESSPAQAIFDEGVAYLEKGERKKGCQRYLDSADKGLVMGHFGVGLCYHEGDGWEHSNEKALKHLELAANAGLAPAQVMMGHFFMQGTTGTKDEAKGIDWYEKAAIQGNHLAQFSLGRYYSAQPDAASHLKAHEYFSQSAAANYAPAQYELGLLYGTGKGVAVSQEKAREWYEKSANGKYAPAQYNLALMYAKGEGIKKDQQIATRWMQESASNGFEKAKEVMGLWEKEKKHKH